ncbi:hypothetical protein EV175_002758 [Coemansia sp. RSA 1933]|nr:hypothetical protein EV175_002758 [Coemansia sp. RSA 1933]
MDDIPGDSEAKHRGCMPLAKDGRPREDVRKGISWQDVPPEHSSGKETKKCKYCNMQVTPAASLLWHQRVCALSAGQEPVQCELCQRPFTSPVHARNHLFYGCSPGE